MWNLEAGGREGGVPKDGLTGAQAQGPPWGIGYRGWRAKGRLRLRPCDPFLCPHGLGSMGAGLVESWQTGRQAEHTLEAGLAWWECTGMDIGFFPG